MSKLGIVLMLLAAAIWPCTTVTIPILYWQKSAASSTPYFAFWDGRKAGFINSAGRIVIPARYFEEKFRTGDFFGGIARVGASYIGASGKVAIQPETGYLPAGNFSEGLALVQKDGRYGYVDRTGHVAIPARFAEAEDFSEGRAVFAEPSTMLLWERHEGRRGYIDRSGRIAIPPVFAAADGFREGLARVALDGKCWVRWKGVPRGAPAVPAFRPFDGFSCDGPPYWVREPCRQGFIDASGRVVIAPRFHEVGEFHEGMAWAREEGRIGFLDHSGNFAIAPSFSSAGDFSEGVAAAMEDGKWGYVDRKGKWVVAAKYDSAEAFSDGLGLVRLGRRTIYLTKTGARVLTVDSMQAGSFAFGLAPVWRGKSYGEYIDRKGRVVFRYRIADPPVE